MIISFFQTTFNFGLFKPERLTFQGLHELEATVQQAAREAEKKKQDYKAAPKSPDELNPLEEERAQKTLQHIQEWRAPANMYDERGQLKSENPGYQQTKEAQDMFIQKYEQYRQLGERSEKVDARRQVLVQYLREVLMQGGSAQDLEAAYRKESDRISREKADIIVRTIKENELILSNEKDFKENFMPALLAHAIANGLNPSTNLLVGDLERMVRRYNEVATLSAIPSRNFDQNYQLEAAQRFVNEEKDNWIKVYRAVNEQLTEAGKPAKHYNEALYADPAAPAAKPASAPRRTPAATPRQTPAPTPPPRKEAAPDPMLVARREEAARKAREAKAQQEAARQAAAQKAQEAAAQRQEAARVAREAAAQKAREAKAQQEAARVAAANKPAAAPSNVEVRGGVNGVPISDKEAGEILAQMGAGAKEGGEGQGEKQAERAGTRKVEVNDKWIRYDDANILANEFGGAEAKANGRPLAEVLRQTQELLNRTEPMKFISLYVSRPDLENPGKNIVVKAELVVRLIPRGRGVPRDTVRFYHVTNPQTIQTEEMNISA